MVRDPLTILVRLKRLQVNERRRDLAAQEQYRATLEGHIASTEQAWRTAEPHPEDYAANSVHMEVYQRHSERLRYQNQMLRLHLPQVMEKLDTARRALATARVSAHALEELLSMKESQRQTSAARHERGVLDDIARDVVSRRRTKC
jgi:hypothetical protein